MTDGNDETDTAFLMNIPHTFPSLLNLGVPPPVLFIGAGMSFRLVPVPVKLAQDICNRFDEVTKILGIAVNKPSTAQPKDLYDWADAVFNELIKTLSADEAKLRLADAMGVVFDPRFQAKVGIPLRGNTPRHRIAARFAREKRWEVIWSLNWDCIMETALESVGLLPHPAPATNQNNPLPWRRWYCTWSPGDGHAPTSKKDCTLHVIKPHGCVNKLAKGQATFVVTTSELNNLPATMSSVNGRIKVVFSDSPLTVVGWSAEEDYIHQDINAVKQQHTLATTADRLSIIDPYWSPTPPSVAITHHNRLADAFNIQRDDCHFQASSTGNPTTDQFFQWLQTRYGLERLEQFATAVAWNTESTELQSIKNMFPEPQPTDWLNSFFDDFLAVWVRLCCNAGKVIYKQNGVAIQPDVIATHRRDEHIPWAYGHSDRPDLLAAIPLILALRKTPPATTWNFDEFPGALWDEINCHLVLPLPAWDENNNPLQLAGIKPLMEGWGWARKGVIQRLSILPLLPQQSYTPINDDPPKLRSSIAWLMKSSKFSIPENIRVVALADI